MTERKFVHPTQISQHLVCPICQDVFTDPIRIDCGHTFCKACIDFAAKSNNLCPICRAKLKKARSRDLIAYNIIGDLLVYCPSLGCKWSGAIFELQFHIAKCPKADGSAIPEWLVPHLSENGVPMKNNLIERIVEKSGHSILAKIEEIGKENEDLNPLFEICSGVKRKSTDVGPAKIVKK